MIDITSGVTPKHFLRGEWFVGTALLTSAVYIPLWYAGVSIWPATLIAAAVGFTFRVLALHFKWEEPEPWEPRAGDSPHGRRRGKPPRPPRCRRNSAHPRRHRYPGPAAAQPLMAQEAAYMMQARAVAPGRFSPRNVYLPAQISVGAVLALNFLLLLDNLIPTRWGTIGLEALLLLSLVITTPRDPREESRAHRRLQAALISLLAVANGVAVVQLARFLVLGGNADGRSLILSGLVVWMTNIVLFGLIFWELDRGGPRARARSEGQKPDFQFPQMTDERLSRDGTRSSSTISTFRSPTRHH